MLRTSVLTLILASMAFAQAEPGATASIDDAEAKIRIDALKKALSGQTIEPKQEAITACSESMHPACAAALLPVLTRDSDELRIYAADALGRMKGLENAAKTLHAALKSNENKTSVLDRIFRAMENVGHISSVAVCQDWAEDRVSQRDSEEIAGVTSAIETLGSLKFKASVDALLDIWHKNKVVGKDRGSSFKEKCRKFCNQALRRLLGEKMESWDEWHDWWKKEAKNYNSDLSQK